MKKEEMSEGDGRKERERKEGRKKVRKELESSLAVMSV
jgi:hypothetical protein